MTVMERLANSIVVPVVVLDKVEDAIPTAKAMAAGGVDTMEITFRTACAPECIKAVADNCPDVLVGAGTIINVEQAKLAVSMGAKFIVSPGFNPKIVKYCVEKGIPVCPGCTTCGEMEQAMELGLDVVKFFPAEAIGGLNVIKSVSGPYPKLKFMPTGGINEDNILSYLKNPKILACGGSFMVKDSLINEGKFDEIEKLAKKAVALMHGFEIVHVGINSENKEEGEKTATLLCKLFLLEPDVRSKATFAGTKFEVMHLPFRGKNGHIALGCNFPDRARSYLERLGVEFDESTATYDEKGKLKFVYMKDDIGGFAFHLIQK